MGTGSSLGEAGWQGPGFGRNASNHVLVARRRRSSRANFVRVYLRGCGPPVNAADGALLFTNEVDGARPKLEHVLVGRSDPAAVDAAIARGAELLALPS